MPGNWFWSNKIWNSDLETQTLVYCQWILDMLENYSVKIQVKCKVLVDGYDQGLSIKCIIFHNNKKITRYQKTMSIELLMLNHHM